MNSTAATDAGVDFRGPPHQLELLLAYEDQPTAERAKRALDRVFNNPDLNAQAQFRLWQLGKVGDPELGPRAAREAAAADILVLSMHGRRRLSPETEFGLRQWVDVKRDKPCALVISLDADAKSLAEENPALAELRSAATRNGITVMLHFGEPGQSGSASPAALGQSGPTLPVLNNPSASRPSSAPRWGINE